MEHQNQQLTGYTSLMSTLELLRNEKCITFWVFQPLCLMRNKVQSAGLLATYLVTRQEERESEVPNLAAPRGNSWGVPAYLFHCWAPRTHTHDKLHKCPQELQQSCTKLRFSPIPPALTLQIHQYPGGSTLPISATPAPWVCKLRTKAQLINKLWQNSSNQTQARSIHCPCTPTPPILVMPLTLLSQVVTPLLSLWPQPAFLHFKKQGHAEHSTGVGNQNRRGQRDDS